jgi:hypothetical protein
MINQYVFDETKPFAIHELAQHVPPKNSSNPSPIVVAFASNFAFHKTYTMLKQ